MRSLHSERQIELHYVGMDTPADSTEFYDRHNMKCFQDNSTIKQKKKKQEKVKSIVRAANTCIAKAW